MKVLWMVIVMITVVRGGGKNKKSPATDTAIDELHPWAQTYDRQLLAQNEQYFMQLAKTYDYVRAVKEDLEAHIAELQADPTAFARAVEDLKIVIPSVPTSAAFAIYRERITDWVILKWIEVQLANLLDFGYTSVQIYELFANVHYLTMQRINEIQDRGLYMKTFLRRGSLTLIRAMAKESGLRYQKTINFPEQSMHHEYEVVFQELYQSDFKNAYDLSKKIKSVSRAIQKFKVSDSELQQLASSLEKV
jgi:HPt (histidine-containing phosphotransfer) domain-containing protein